MLAASPSGMRMVVTDSANTVTLLDVSTRKAVRTFNSPLAQVPSVGVHGLLDGCWCLDDESLLLTAKGRVILVDLGTGAPVWDSAVPSGKFAHVCVGSSERALVGLTEFGNLWRRDVPKLVNVTEPAPWRLVTRLEPPGFGVLDDPTGAGWWSDGRISGSSDLEVLAVAHGANEVRLVRSDGWRSDEAWPGSECEVSHVGIACDGSRVITGTASCQVMAWDLDGKLAEKRWASGGLLAYLGPVGETPWLLSISETGAARLWTASGLEPVTEALLPPLAKGEFAVSRDGGVLVLRDRRDGRLLLIDVASGSLEPVEISLRAHDPTGVQRNPYGKLQCMAVSPTGSQVLVVRERAVEVVDTQTGAVTRRERSERSTIFAADCIGSGGWLLLGRDAAEHAEVIYFNVASGIRTGRIEERLATSMAVSRDGTIVCIGTSDGRVSVFRVADGQILASREAHGGSVIAVAFSSRGDMIASGCSDTSAEAWKWRE